MPPARAAAIVAAMAPLALVTLLAALAPDPGVCVEDGRNLRCDHEQRDLTVGGAVRHVYVARPRGAPPQRGWPAVLLFQGSFFQAELFFDQPVDGLFGGHHQVRTVDALLRAGYAVIAPDTELDGHAFWDTNTLLWAQEWRSSPDHHMMRALFAAIDDGTFGPLDPTLLFAAGISSGGYMTSRVANEDGARLRAVAIQSASFCTCAGWLCLVPDGFAADHPPTLFLHGERDLVVPVWTMRAYAHALAAAGVEVRIVTDPHVGHAWIPAAPDAVVAFFAAHR